MKYFKEKDFACKCGCGENVSPYIMDLADRIREFIGCPCIITSGKRCEAHNAKEGGSKSSHHRFGNAIDIRVHPNDKVLNKKIFDYIKNNEQFTELIDEYDFSWVHVAVVNGRENEKRVKKIG